MSKRNTGLTELRRLMTRATVLVAIMAAPLMMVDVASGGSDNIIEGTYKASSGAGFVLMVSLQRAQ